MNHHYAREIVNETELYVEHNGYDITPDGWEHFGFYCELTFEGTTIEMIYKQGKAHTSEPEIDDILLAMVADKDAYESAKDAADFSSMFGYAPKEGLDTYNACKANLDKLVTLYGEACQAVCDLYTGEDANQDFYANN